MLSLIKKKWTKAGVEEELTETGKKMKSSSSKCSADCWWPAREALVAERNLLAVECGYV